MIKTDNNFLTKKAIRFYFFSDLIKYSTKNKKTLFFVLLIIASIFLCNVILFLNRIKLWVYFNNKENTLPIASSKNTTFYITAMIVDMESIINYFIIQMKQLINFLGKQNIVISFIENGDSKDHVMIIQEDI